MRKLSSQTLPWPTNWADLFGADRPLIVEIGFGYGAFLLHLARSNPDASVIGLEVANRCLTQVENAIVRHRLANVRVIHATAETALHHLFRPASISQVHINFPDPWFKQRHSGRRLMQADTLDALINRLAPGGMLYLATDILAYAEMSSALLAAAPGLKNTLAAPWADSLPGRVTTKYEGRARREGRPCCYFAYQRAAAPPPVIPLVKELDMPHVVFESQLSLDEMLAQFQPSQHHVHEAHISFMHVYRGEHTLLFEVFVKEPTIDQRFALILVEHAGRGGFTLKLSTLGHPRPTPGIHAAAAILGTWLAGLHPQAQVLTSKLKG